MPPSLTSGSSIIVSVQNTDVDIGLRHGPKGSALPIIPQSVSRGARFSRLRWFATAAACQVAGPPCTDLTGLPANGGFYFQAFDRSVALPVAGYNYNSVWTPLLAGLSPAGMAASLAALVRPCSSPASKKSWQGGDSDEEITIFHKLEFDNCAFRGAAFCNTFPSKEDIRAEHPGKAF
jgi:hypothetical protein